jgi:hypothetical protein
VQLWVEKLTSVDLLTRAPKESLLTSSCNVKVPGEEGAVTRQLRLEDSPCRRVPKSRLSPPVLPFQLRRPEMANKGKSPTLRTVHETVKLLPGVTADGALQLALRPTKAR